MKYRNILAIVMLVTAILLGNTAYAATVATGKTDGFYHNDLFAIFSNSMTRMGSKDPLTKYSDEGTDGSKANVALVNSGQADIAFAQLDAYALSENKGNVEVVGVVMYEVAHLVAPKKGKVQDSDGLESGNKNSVSINMLSGSAITYDVMIKVDKDYKNAQVKDSDSHTRSIAEMTRGELDSMFFVSTPGTKAIGRINEVSELEFKDCWDRDFDDYKVNGKQLYTKVKVGKKNGYSNNFVTFRVPAVVIANKDFLAKNKSMFDTLFDATNMTYKAVKGAKKLEYYPED